MTLDLTPMMQPFFLGATAIVLAGAVAILIGSRRQAPRAPTAPAHDALDRFREFLNAFTSSSRSRTTPACWPTSSACSTSRSRRDRRTG